MRRMKKRRRKKTTSSSSSSCCSNEGWVWRLEIRRRRGTRWLANCHL
jgi:hypothetical protein